MNLENFTSTELLKSINDIKSKHESIKNEIIDLTNIIDETEIKINNKINELTKLEENYVILIDELNNRYK